LIGPAGEAMQCELQGDLHAEGRSNDGATTNALLQSMIVVDESAWSAQDI